jgi:predicted membrane-bound spermidine synthase
MEQIRQKAALSVICLVFFFSGFPALVYQLIWQRSLFAIYGINIESVTVIVAAFMLGLGLSSGSWAEVIANHPQVEKLTVVEINPGYLKLIRMYSTTVSILDNPKVKLIIDDGRRWLHRNPKKRFDLIVMNTTYNWRSNVTNLLSTEFLKLARRHLVKNGMLFFNDTGSDRAQRTAVHAFPHAIRVDNFMLVSDGPINLDGERWGKYLAQYAIDGKRVFEPGDEKQQERLRKLVDEAKRFQMRPDRRGTRFESKENIEKRTAEARLITDDNMGNEWDYLYNPKK